MLISEILEGYNPIPLDIKDPNSDLRNYSKVVEMVPVDWLKKLPGNSLRNSDSEQQAFHNDVVSQGLKHPLIITVGKKSRTAKLGEGNHRLAVAIAAGYDYIPARVIVGSEWGSDKMAKGTLDKDLIPIADKYFPSDAKPSDVFRSLQGLTKPIQ